VVAVVGRAGARKRKEVACALLYELERLTKSRGSELIVLIQHADGEGIDGSRERLELLIRPHHARSPYEARLIRIEI